MLKASQLNAFDTIVPAPGWDEAYIRLTSSGTHDLAPSSQLASLTIEASSFGETITLPSSSTTGLVWFGFGGNDTVRGGARVDSLYGGAGGDQAWGYAGNDIAFMEEDDDVFYGGSGNDTGYGGLGNDRVSGWVHNDTLFGDDGNDQVYGENDNDTLYGDAGNDALYGGSGTDVAYGGANTDAVYGGDDGDRLYGGAGSDRVSGSAGVDRLTGGSSGDTFVASAQGAGVSTPDQILDFASGDRIDVSPLLPGYDDTQDLSDYVSKSVSGTTVTFRVEGASVIQALDPSGGELTGLTVDQLHDQGILLA